MFFLFMMRDQIVTRIITSVWKETVAQLVLAFRLLSAAKQQETTPSETE